MHRYYLFYRYIIYLLHDSMLLFFSLSLTKSIDVEIVVKTVEIANVFDVKADPVVKVCCTVWELMYLVEIVDDFVEMVDGIVDRMFVVLVEELKVDILVLAVVDNWSSKLVADIKSIVVGFIVLRKVLLFVEASLKSLLVKAVSLALKVGLFVFRVVLLVLELLELVLVVTIDTAIILLVVLLVVVIVDSVKLNVLPSGTNLVTMDSVV